MGVSITECVREHDYFLEITNKQTNKQKTSDIWTVECQGWIQRRGWKSNKPDTLGLCKYNEKFRLHSKSDEKWWLKVFLTRKRHDHISVIERAFKSYA